MRSVRTGSYTTIPTIVLTTALVGSMFGSTPATLEATTTPLPKVEFVVSEVQNVKIEVPETLEQMAERIAGEHGINPEHLKNLAHCESTWNTDAIGDKGHARGLVQINDRYWPEVTPEQAFDPEFALAFAAEKIAEGKGYLWTCGNCVSFVKTKVSNLPKQADIRSNTGLGVGVVALFSYSTDDHMAYVEKVENGRFLVSECNYKAYTCGTRWIDETDPHLVGYWLSTPEW